ncbi:MAG: glycoside hydrolase [Clostridia bacterium]|nr:glycoside hydrolase [Clostridia bacterium]
MMNKPIVLSTGEWMFPVAVWAKDVKVLPRKDVRDEEIGSWAYVTKDEGKTFERRGRADIPDRSYDEHLFLEKKNGSLAVFVRTRYGVGTALSKDGGYTWSEGKPSDIKGPCSRFYIGRLPSGRVLMVNHHRFTGRNNLTAFLSDDDGETWSHTLLLDERDQVSYPDVSLRGGDIYIVYDRERGSGQYSMSAVLAQAREILTAKITEEDILAGKLVSKGSYLKHIASKLTEYKGKVNPFEETSR